MPLSGFIRHKLSVYTYKVHTTEVYKGPPTQSDDDKNQVQVRFFLLFVHFCTVCTTTRKSRLTCPFHMHIGLSMMIGNPEQFHRIFGAKKMISPPTASHFPWFGFSHLLMEIEKSGKKGEGKDMTIKQKKIFPKSIHFWNSFCAIFIWNKKVEL